MTSTTGSHHPTAPSSKRQYRAPKLISYGSLAHLTAGGPAGSTEMTMMSMITRRA